MMKVNEFIEYLKTLDQEAIVNVLVAEPMRGWEGGKEVSVEEFDPTKHVDELDARGESYAKYPQLYGKHEYTFGEKY